MADTTIDDVLIEDHLDLASRLARGYRGRGVEPDDLVQVARLALVKAARRYEAERGAFAPFAATTIRGELKRYFRDRAWGVRPPRRIQELQAQLSQEFEANPRESDARRLAERLDAPVADIREAQAARGCYSCDSVEAAEEAGHPFAVNDERYEQIDQWESFCTLCHHLTDDEKNLLRWRFIDELTQQRIADRLGISQMQVSRRLSALLSRLRRQAEAA